MLTKDEEQTLWRIALESARKTAETATEPKVSITATSVLMDGLRAVSELRRGRAWVSSGPAAGKGEDIAAMLKGLVPGEVKRQRKGDLQANSGQSAEDPQE